MHKKYKNDLINEINALSSERMQSRRLEADQQTPKRKYGRRRQNRHIPGSMDTTFSTIAL